MAKHNPAAMHQRQTGFTLIEISIVLFILALVLGGLLPTLSSQVEQRHLTETRARLDEIKEALIGYAIINGRLPCPATLTSNGVENFASGGSTSGYCSNFLDGYVPAATLGLSGTDSAGLIEDAWGNPIRYAVTNWQSGGNYVFTAYDATNSKGMKFVGISNLSPNLLVCSTSSGISGTACGSGYSLTPNGVPAVIYSIGKNGSSGGTSADEKANPNPNFDDNNHTFVSHDIAATSGNQFDDLVSWISTNVLITRMVTAGKLP